MIDLDRFKEVNDTFGHGQGDRLLQAVAQRFQHALRGGGTIARMGGDEFAVVLPGAGVEAARRVAEGLLGLVSQPVTLDGLRTVSVGASIGAATCPEHGRDSMTLLRRADAAMYAAKRAGGGFAMYSAKPSGDTSAESLTNSEGLLQSTGRTDEIEHWTIGAAA